MTERPLISVRDPIAPLLMTTYGAAFGIQGFVHSAVRRILSITLTLVQRDCRVKAIHQVLLDKMIDPRIASEVQANGAAGLDGGFYVSAVFPPVAALCPGLATVEAHLAFDDGSEAELRLCFARVDIVSPISRTSRIGSDILVGIAMATYDPEPPLFRGQIDSIRAQTHREWICVISDDGSNPKALENIRDYIKDDARFILLQSETRLGFYRNFERALSALPLECQFVAFADQDDIWSPGRLLAGLEELSHEKVECVYSDMEVFNASGSRLSSSFWVHRRQHYGSLTGLMLANVATGMTMLFKSDLIPILLPFPATPHLAYHDAWIALIAESRNSLRYMPIAVAKYIQHGGNHTGALTPPDKSRVVLARNLRQASLIMTIPLWKVRDPHKIKELLANMAYWGDGEPTRIRILADALRARLPNNVNSHSYTGLASVCGRFGIVALLRAGVDWRDRYRRSVAIALIVNVKTESLVLAYAKWNRTRARHSSPN